MALVTGANKGIGFAVAAGLGRLGATVLVGARDPGRGAAAAARLVSDGIVARPIRLDVDDDTSVCAAIGEIEHEVGALDVLVNNAAVKLEVSPSPPSAADVATVRATFETNVFGAIRVTLAALPLLRRSARPRVVNVSSVLGSTTLAATPSSPIAGLPLLAYNSSKAALNSVTVQFANELRETSFKINAADPGYTRTDMTAQSRWTDRDTVAAADVVVRLATLPDDGPTGCFFDEHGEVPW